MDKLILLLTFLTTSLFCVGQEHTVRGVVTAYNHFPLENVSVSAKKSKAVATTNEQGEFEIKVDTKDVVIIEAHGFKSFRKKIRDYSENLNVNLVFKEREKDVAVAVGYGYISEKNLTYAINHYSDENNDFGRYSSIYELVTSLSPGVTIIYENGGPQFQIRGKKSLLGSNAALIIVDGMPMEDISFLSTWDVAHIEILKDASASVYGSRGANGVILIETKRSAH